MNVTLDLATFIMAAIGLMAGALAAYFGAMTSVRVQIARMEARLEAFERHAQALEARVQDANERMNRLLRHYRDSVPAGLHR